MRYLRKINSKKEYETFLNTEVNFPNVSKLWDDTVIYTESMSRPLWIEAISDTVIRFTHPYEYSKDNYIWESGSSNTEISLKAGEVCFFRKDYVAPDGTYGIGSFSLTKGRFNIGGNIQSMRNGVKYQGVNDVSSFQFYKLFYRCTGLINANKLIMPTGTGKSCYKSMFNGCTSLRTAPVLPATTLKGNCYESMFGGCSSLVNAPELPATTTQADCYRGMFVNCTSLVNAPELSATILDSSAYAHMFNGCTNLAYIKMMGLRSTYSNKEIIDEMYEWVTGAALNGVFVKNAKATWNYSGMSAVPRGWTIRYYDNTNDKYVIKFSINDTQYMGEELSTWNDWVNSIYNTDGYTLSNTNVLSADGVKVMVDGVAVVATDAITSQGVYTLEVTETASEA